MIVYVFYNTFFKKIFLPTKVVGIYPVYLNENKLLFNIEGIDGKWYIKVSDNDVVYKVRDQVIKPELEEYIPYVLTVSRVNLMLIAAPIYNENSRLVNYVKSEFTAAVTTYSTKVREAVEAYNSSAELESSFKGQVQTDLKDFVEETKKLLNAWVKLVDQWSKEAEEAYKTWAEKDKDTVSANVQNAIEDVKQMAQNISLD